MKTRLALPKGRLQGEIARLLHKGGLRLENYEEGSRSYRPKAPAFPNLMAKVFQEKDIPIQVAIGNYDLGICGLDWVDEHMVRFPGSSLVKVQALGVGSHEIWAVVSLSSD
ncbi:MAG: ATP phosphoribosyltransferase, partial [Dehalococcoidia bacterium]|nr:ATP phosphoribosyltransferase [Dehalococcoidia bacterium]